MMDAFHSEPLTSDSSSQGDTAPQNQKKLLTRKTRRTEDLISVNISKSLQQDSKQTSKRQLQNNSFLPKIELSDNVKPRSILKRNEPKQNRPSLAKKAAVFKIGRSMIEGKQFKLCSKSKFPKIKLKLFNKDKTKNRHKMGQENSKKPRSSGELVQVVSDAAEQFLSESGSKRKYVGKRTSKSFSRKSKENNNESRRMVFKDLYVNLVPLEKTNLLNENQRMQLKPKQMLTECLLPLSDSAFNKRNSESNTRKLCIGKENKLKAEIQNNAKLSHDGRKTKSYSRKSISCFETIVPCTVILERLTLEQIQLLTLSKQNQESFNACNLLPNENTSANNTVPSIERNLPVVNLYRLSSSINSKTESFLRKSSLSKSGEKPNRSLNNNEESFFDPKGSSSPMNTPQKSSMRLIDPKPTLSVSPSIERRLTYEVDGAKALHSTNLLSDAEVENKDGTYEVAAGSPTRRSSTIRKGFEELPRLSVTISETNTGRNTSSIKSRRKSKSSTKNETYELNYSSNEGPGNNKDVTFEIDVANHCKSVPSAKLSNSYEGGERHRSYDLHIQAGKKRRSKSCDARVFAVTCLSENKLRFEEQKKTPTPNIQKRRSTLTLEDSVNDITLLKSTCDSSGTPRKLNRSGKAKPQTLTKQVLDNKSLSDQLDYSNVTIRKHCSSSESMRDSLKRRASCDEPTTYPDDISKPWGSLEDTEMTGFSILPSSFAETTQDVENEKEDSSEEVEQLEVATNTAVLEKPYKANANGLSKATSSHTNIIEVSDDEEASDDEEVTDDEESSSSEPGQEKQLEKQGRRVTFQITKGGKRQYSLSKSSLAKANTRKSMLKNDATSGSPMKKRRVTFSDMSVIIIDDSSTSDGSPERKSTSTLVPTNFPSDDSSDESPSSNKSGTVDHTPNHTNVESPTVSNTIQSPRFRAGRTPIQLQSDRDITPHFNKRGTVGRTPLRLKMPVENNAVKRLNKRLSSGERTRLQGESSAVKKTDSNTAPKKTNMPDFASMHKKMYDKMLNLEEYSKRKDERAKLLLSGSKPAKAGSSLKKSASKQVECNSRKKVFSKKQLNYEGPSTSASSSSHKQGMQKKPIHPSSTPKSKRNGFTPYGFKLTDDQAVTKKEQLVAVANKTRPPKSNTAENRTEIKGVRSNRRFDLLMKMREKSNRK